MIKDLPAEVHAELARRAAAENKSLRAYLREVLTEHVAVPSIDQWLRHLRELGPTQVGGHTGTELVAAAPGADDELIGC